MAEVDKFLGSSNCGPVLQQVRRCEGKLIITFSDSAELEWDRALIEKGNVGRYAETVRCGGVHHAGDSFERKLSINVLLDCTYDF